MKNERIKIVINRPAMKSEEINAMQDFTAVMKGFGKISKPIYKKGWFVGGASAILVAAVTVLLVTTNKNTGSETSETGTTVQPQTTAPAGTPFINPAIKGIDIEFTTFTVESGRADTLEMPTGTRVILPACPFVDGGGKTINGKVDIKFREFRDPVDFAISGIPMTYDSAGQRYVFESAGMYEIQGWQNGQAIQVNPGCPLTIEQKPTAVDGKFNMYYLDTVAKNWEFKGKPKWVMDDKVKMQIEVSDTCINCTENIQTVTNAIAPLASGSNLTGDVGVTDTITLRLNNELRELQKKLWQEEVKAPRKLNESRMNFRILADEGLYPELAPFANTIFEIDETAAKFHKNQFSISWGSAVLTDMGDGRAYKLMLNKTGKGGGAGARLKRKRHWWQFWGKSDTEMGDTAKSDEVIKPIFQDIAVGDSIKLVPLNAALKIKNIDSKSKLKKELKVFPVLAGADYDKALAEFNKKLKPHQEAVKKKEEELKKHIADQEEKERAQWEAIRKQQEERNKQLTEAQRKQQEQWAEQQRKWAEEQKKNVNDRSVDANNIYAAFQAERFGIYNCDCKGQLNLIRPLNISFSSDGTPINASIYLIIKNKNAMMLNWGSRVNFQPNDRNVLFAPLSDGRIGYLNESDFTKIINTGGDKATLNVSTEKFETVGQIKAFLGIGETETQQQ